MIAPTVCTTGRSHDRVVRRILWPNQSDGIFRYYIPIEKWSANSSDGWFVVGRMTRIKEKKRKERKELKSGPVKGAGGEGMESKKDNIIMRT